MKIDQTIVTQAVEDSGQSGPTKGTQGGSDAFATLLQNEVGPTGQADGQDSAVCGPGALGGLYSTQAIIPSSPQTSSSSETVSSLSSIFDGLDSLQDALNASKSPKEINSLIERINGQAAGLDDKMSGLPADSPLRDLAEETKVTAYMESLKFKRGDYL
ncbi:MAG: hypothetical protein ACP5IL_10965 [Syntrophobacteraceae bacterium]